MHEVTATVLDVQGRQSKNGQHTMYDVSLSDGNKYTTFDAQTANAAAALRGQQVTAHVEVKQKGKYTNYDLEAIGPAGTLGPVPVEAGTPIPAANGTSPTPAIPIAPPQQSKGGFSEADKIRVTKLAVLGTAFQFVGGFFQGAGPEAIPQAQELAYELAKSLFEQARRHEQPEAQAVIDALASSLPQTPQEVAAVVPGVQVGVETAPQETAKAGVQW